MKRFVVGPNSGSRLGFGDFDVAKIEGESLFESCNT